MADVIDDAGEYIERMEERNIAAIRARAASMPTGHPGDCAKCGEESLRIVRGLCAPCRDKYNK